MMNGIYYLNNNGSRWVVYANGNKEKSTWKNQSGNDVVRTVIFYESFGNFVSATISYKGKKISVLMDTILED